MYCHVGSLLFPITFFGISLVRVEEDLLALPVEAITKGYV